MDRADSAAGHGWPVSGTRPPAANPPQAGASPGCPFSWLLLFGQAKRSDPLAQRAEAFDLSGAMKQKAKAKALGPGFRRDDEGWKAFADENQDQNGFRPSPE